MYYCTIGSILWHYSYSLKAEVLYFIMFHQIFLRGTNVIGVHSGIVVKALHYKPAGHWFDSRWCHWHFSGRTMALGSTHPLTEMSTRYFLGVRAAGA